MKPIACWPAAEAQALSVLFFDLDDTVLTQGALSRVAYNAVCDLAERSGLKLIAITGRPAGWGEVLARQWPLHAVITENGAVCSYRKKHAVERLLFTESSLEDTRLRLAKIEANVRAKLPLLNMADDNALRLTDRTFDIGENHHALSEEIALAKAVIRDNGATTLQSSIHLHAMLHRLDKATGALMALRVLFSLDAGEAKRQCAFVGDSENDASCFAFFDTTFGVANVTRAAKKLSRTPRYVTEHAFGEGFSEVAQRILALRA